MTFLIIVAVILGVASVLSIAGSLAKIANALNVIAVSYLVWTEEQGVELTETPVAEQIKAARRS